MDDIYPSLSLHTIEDMYPSVSGAIMITVRFNNEIHFFKCLGGFKVDMTVNRIIGTFKLERQ